MKMIASVLVCGLTSTLLLAAESELVVVRGDPVAVVICRTILNDDVERLDRNLLRYQFSSRLLAFYFSGGDAAIVRDFSCNKLSLLEFADQQGAISVSHYLQQKIHRKGTVHVDEMIASTN